MKCPPAKKAKCRRKRKVCNPLTGRCIKVGGKVYKRVFPNGHHSSTGQVAPQQPTKMRTHTNRCPPAKKAKCRSKGKVCNPITGRCLKVGGKVYKRVFPNGHQVSVGGTKTPVAAVVTPPQPSSGAVKVANDTKALKKQLASLIRKQSMLEKKFSEKKIPLSTYLKDVGKLDEEKEKVSKQLAALRPTNKCMNKTDLYGNPIHQNDPDVLSIFVQGEGMYCIRKKTLLNNCNYPLTEANMRVPWVGHGVNRMGYGGGGWNENRFYILNLGQSARRLRVTVRGTIEAIQAARFQGGATKITLVRSKYKTPLGNIRSHFTVGGDHGQKPGDYTYRLAGEEEYKKSALKKYTLFQNAYEHHKKQLELDKQVLAGVNARDPYYINLLQKGRGNIRGVTDASGATKLSDTIYWHA